MSTHGRRGWAFGATLLGVVSWELAACGGKSGHDQGTGGTAAAGSSASSGTGAEIGTGEGAASGDGGGGTASANGGTGSTNAGSGGSSAGFAGQSRGGGAGSAGGGAVAGGMAGSGITPGCDYGGVHYESGADWPVDCNRCFCEAGEVACTTRECSASGGMGGNAGSGTAGSAGAGGAKPTPADCALEVGSLCIEGTPTDGGHQLDVGMPMIFTLRPEGCFSSSCTQLASFDCNYIGSEHDFYVGGFFCVTTEGDACTDDCGGAPEATCDLGKTLSAGEYTIGLSGGAGAVLSELKFTVPGVVLERDRCTHPL